MNLPNNSRASGRRRRIVVVFEERGGVDDHLHEALSEIGVSNQELLDGAGDLEGLEDDANVYLLTIPGLGMRLATVGEIRTFARETFLVSKNTYRFADFWSAIGVRTTAGR